MHLKLIRCIEIGKVNGDCAKGICKQNMYGRWGLNFKKYIIPEKVFSVLSRPFVLAGSPKGPALSI
jgi:hypothetical protein